MSVKSSQIVSTNRRFDLDMRDRIRGVWDDAMGIPVISHLVVEAQGIEQALLNNEGSVRELIRKVCGDSALAPVGRALVHAFDGGGITALQVLRTSHLAVHTWPEAGYVHIEIVTCVDNLQAMQVEDSIRHVLNPDNVRVLKLRY
jgi:S-adenosylmethionine decarboxylase